MSERKYRQRGYQDEPRGPKTPSAPKPQEPRGPRDPTEFRVTKTVGSKRCGVDLRSCVQCESFDPGARFECRQSIPARVAPKDERNRCELFHPTVRVERETGSTAPTSARKAFDDLFK